MSERKRTRQRVTDDAAGAARARARTRSRRRGGGSSGGGGAGDGSRPSGGGAKGGPEQPAPKGSSGGSKGSSGGGRKRKRGSRKRNKKRRSGAGFWGRTAWLPQAEQDVRITDDPAAVARSLGPPPLPGHERVAEHYFTVVYERAVTTAGALAAAGGLIDPDALAEELGDGPVRS